MEVALLIGLGRWCSPVAAARIKLLLTGWPIGDIGSSESRSLHPLQRLRTHYETEADRLQRFVQETKTLVALDHPNIRYPANCYFATSGVLALTKVASCLART